MTAEPLDPAAVDLSVVPRFRDRVTLVPVADEAVLYDEESGALHPMNATAARICTFLDGRSSLATAASELAATFDVDPAEVAADIVAMVRQLADGGLLVGIGPEPVSPRGRR